LIAQATAQGVCLGLDMSQELACTDIEHVEIPVDNVASQQLDELACDAEP